MCVILEQILASRSMGYALKGRKRRMMSPAAKFLSTVCDANAIATPELASNVSKPIQGMRLCGIQIHCV